MFKGDYMSGTALKEIYNRIQKAKQDYYQTGRSELSDFEYDRLIVQAEKLGIIDTVGAKPVKSIPVIKHDHLMLSLDKVHTVNEITDFVADKDFVVMYKADGLSISATYEDGVLTKLETRGDGVEGNNVLFHANSFVNLPKVINKDGKYVIDGECVILYSDFEKINEILPEGSKYSNPRNLAAGSLNQLDPAISKTRFLRFYAWDVIEGNGKNSLFEGLNDAIKLGFDVVRFLKTNDRDSEHLSQILNDFRESAKSEGFPIDGCVIKFDDISYGKTLGKTDRFFRNAVAYKYEDDRYPTKLIKVEFQMGKTGQLTPVAYFEPVEIDGKWIEKCSLHNLTIMKQLGLTIGCTCYVYLANSVIPQIDCAEPDGEEEIKIANVCPICGAVTTIIKDNQSEVLYCTNDCCPGRLLGYWKIFVSKQGMDVDGLSEQTLERFLNLGYLTNMFISLYELKEYKKELYKLDGFGKRSIDKLLAAIEASKDVDLAHFLTSFSIDGIGVGQCKVLAKKFKTFEAFAKACDDGYDFSQISGIGKILSLNIKNWWINNHVQMLDVAEVVRFASDDYMNPPQGNFPLTDKVFVITGSVSHFKNRDELKEKIESLGGKVSGSVSKNTSYLINNDVNSTTGKNKKAKELGVQIISEEDFLELIGEQS